MPPTLGSRTVEHQVVPKMYPKEPYKDGWPSVDSRKNNYDIDVFKHKGLDIFPGPSLVRTGRDLVQVADEVVTLRK